MHPAFSVIYFTTASGAGYGLLAFLGIFAAAGLLPPDRLLGFVGLGLAFALVTSGLVSSTLHLAHPERAWRAFSQVRSSWLSREGVAAVVAYVPGSLFALGWVLAGRLDGWVAVAGIAAAAMAAVTVATTAMIYASLKPVAQWHSPFTLPGYLIFAAMTGAVLLDAVMAAFGRPLAVAAPLAAALTALGWAWKTATWRHDDALPDLVTANSATGLEGGRVRSVEWPHTEQNFVMKEMGYRIARKHAAKLRRVVHVAAFGAPLLLLIVAMLATGPLARVAAAVAPLVQMTGMLVERWLFFASARHTAAVYYRA